MSAVLIDALKRVKHELLIPAAEYVPAIPACWEIIDAALAATQQSPISGEGWQDISTAPKDGTAIDLFLTYDPTNDSCRAFCGGRMTDAHFANGWVAMSSDPDGSDELIDLEVPGIVTATHWRPLPAPPVPSVSDQGSSLRDTQPGSADGSSSNEGAA